MDDLRRMVYLLESRIEELEKRLLQLEVSSSNEPDSPGSRGARSVANWRELYRGMSLKEVRALLGEPVRVSAGPMVTIWAYHDEGSVTFDEGFVMSWSEPSA